MLTRPILVSGAHRSGTTWVGKTLANLPGIAYIHEPFNPRKAFQTDVKPGICTSNFTYWFTYVNCSNEAGYYPALQRAIQYKYELVEACKVVRSWDDLIKLWHLYRQSLHRRFISRPRPLIKDPIAVFSAEWLAERFNLDVIIMVRHPAAFANSLKRNNFRHPFSHFASQKELMQSYLAPFVDEVISYSAKQYDVLDQAILLWRIIYHTVHYYRTRHDKWLFMRYEDLTDTPISGFRKIFSHCKLVYSGDVQQEILQNFHPNRKGWQNGLSLEETKRVKFGTADVWPLFYSETDWET